MTKLASAFAALSLLAIGTVTAEAVPQVQGGFYQENIIKVCGGGSPCVAQFTPVAAGKTLVVRQVDCRIVVTSGITVYGTALHSFGNLISGNSYLTPRTEKSINPANATAWVYSANVMNMFSGTTPTVTAYTSAVAGTFNTYCTITGTYS